MGVVRLLVPSRVSTHFLSITMHFLSIATHFLSITTENYLFQYHLDGKILEVFNVYVKYVNNKCYGRGRKKTREREGAGIIDQISISIFLDPIRARFNFFKTFP